MLARRLLAAAQRRDTFPGLPRPRARVLIAVAPDRATFRRMVGPAAPEWGAAIAFPQSQRIVMQGRTAGSDAGDPFVTLRHEIAHLALYEAMGDIPPRWFDEGYASWSAGEWGRDELFATNLALVWGGMPGLEELDEWFHGGGRDADAAYALAHRAVAELAALDTARGLTLFFRYWREEEGRLDPAVRRAYGLTLPAFEERWQARTRRQYGLIALFADITLASAVLLAPLVPLWIARRRRDRRRLEAMRAADAAEDIRRREEETLRALLGEGDAGGIGGAGDGERRAT